MDACRTTSGAGAAKAPAIGLVGGAGHLCSRPVRSMPTAELPAAVVHLLLRVLLGVPASRRRAAMDAR